MRGQRSQGFPRRHRGLPFPTSEDDGLDNLRDGQLALQRRGRGLKGTNTRNNIIIDPGFIQSCHLLLNGAVEA